MTNLFTEILKKKKFILMAELKLRSPAEGVLGKMEEIEEIAREYKRGGADVISVVAEKKRFGGDLGMVEKVKQATGLCVFVKDFVATEEHLLNIKKAGADLVLLLAYLNPDEKLSFLSKKAERFGLTAVVEVDNEKDLKKVLIGKYPVVAINARNLRDFSIDRQKAISLLKMIPNEIISLAFSGVRNKEDISAYLGAGAKGILIGTTLMKAENKTELLKEFRNI